jgi:hypothetical protein
LSVICVVWVDCVICVVAKTTALAAQLATAAASSGTYGFNAGIELDIDALERQLQAQKTQSIASNLIANNININTNLKPPEFVPYTV